MRNQRGLSFFGFIIIAVLVGLAALTAIKVVPAYTQYFGIRKAIKSVVKDSGSESVTDIRKAYDRQADIGYLKDVTSDQLIITKNGSTTLITVKYEKVVPLVANVSFLFTFDVRESNVAGGAE